jgi:hypothetical protein
VVGEQQWCKEVHLTVRESNMNLEDNVIDGVTTIINRYGKAIILEDDLITSPYFLQYCNEGLRVYKDIKQVYSINGFMYPIDFDTEPTTFLSPIATFSWGWATWADRWNQFEARPAFTEEIAGNPFLKKKFDWADLDKMYMLKHMNTWDIRWYYTAFIRNGLGLFTTKSLVENIGFDGSGTHGGNENMKQQLFRSPVAVECHDSINFRLYSIFLTFFKAAPLSTSQKIKSTIKRILRFRFSETSL